MSFPFYALCVNFFFCFIFATGEYSSGTLKTEVGQTLEVIKLYETRDSASIRRAVENGLLLLYNTMTNPQDEERLTTEFCAQEGTISFVKCICATRELLDAKSKDEQSAEAATPDDKEMWKCYKILLDMIINFSYTSKQLCAELLQHELPNILISDLLNLRDTFMHSKVCM